jgi:hypothetical protein
MGVCLGIYLNVFTLTHAFGFDSLHSEWNAPIPFLFFFRFQVANVGPADYNYDETLGTLRYANRAKNIQNFARINEDPKDALLRQFQKEIEELRKQLENS